MRAENADAILCETDSCSCKNNIDSKAYDVCNLSCQIARLAMFKMAMLILKSNRL